MAAAFQAESRFQSFSGGVHATTCLGIPLHLVNLLFTVVCDIPRMDSARRGNLLTGCRLLLPFRQIGLRWIEEPAPALCVRTGLRVVRITLRVLLPLVGEGTVLSGL